MVAEQDRQLFKFFTGVATTNIVLSFFANIFLIFIIIRAGSKELASYRFLLLAFTINDIWFPFVHLLTLPVICTYRDALVMFSNGILTTKFSICLFAAVFSQTMPIMAHLFIYRLIVLRSPHAASFYTGAKTTVLIAGSVALQLIVWFSNCWYNYHSDDELQRYVKPFLDSEFPGRGKGHIGALYYASSISKTLMCKCCILFSAIDKNEKGLRVSAVLASMGFNAIMTFWFTIIAICAVLIVNSFKAYGDKLAAKTQQLQKQLFKTLVIQVMVPIVCVYLPCGGIINFPMFFRISVVPNFDSASTTLFPVIDAVVTLVGVKIYRGGKRDDNQESGHENCPAPIGYTICMSGTVCIPGPTDFRLPATVHSAGNAVVLHYTISALSMSGCIPLIVVKLVSLNSPSSGTSHGHNNNKQDSRQEANTTRSKIRVLFASLVY